MIGSLRHLRVPNGYLYAFYSTFAILRLFAPLDRHGDQPAVVLASPQASTTREERKPETDEVSCEDQHHSL
jgi:hypothetical protein